MPPAKAFLFLQGPHGPFFRLLGRVLRQTGAQVWRVGFNAGDAAFWGRAPGYIPYQGDLTSWPAAFTGLLEQHGIICLGEDIRWAYDIADLTEELARIAYLTEKLR